MQRCRIVSIRPSRSLERVCDLNFRLAEDWLTGQVDAIIAAGDRFATLDASPRERIQLEFVSANPTGPLTVGNGRGAVLGSTLANVLNAAGHAAMRS